MAHALARPMLPRWGSPLPTVVHLGAHGCQIHVDLGSGEGLDRLAKLLTEGALYRLRKRAKLYG